MREEQFLETLHFIPRRKAPVLARTPKDPVR
jgi:hypothetical protein